MILGYFLMGLLGAGIAGAPPGAANIVVVKTSMQSSLQKALIIAIGAGLGEVTLSLIALHCNMEFSDYFATHPWIQITVFIAFFLVGLFFLMKDRLPQTNTPRTPRGLKTSRFVKGFLLAAINPPVLIFWVLAFLLFHKYLLSISDMSTASVLLLFFTGVFLGKVLVLYFYGKWGKKLEQSSGNSNKVVHRFIGVALLAVSIVQGVRFFIQ